MTCLRPGWAVVTLLVAPLVLSACTSEEMPRSNGGAVPWPDRPVVDLRFEVDEDLRTVAGREHVLFTPDLRTCELVFRAWPNKPATARAGSALVVSEVLVDGARAAARDVSAGAPDTSPAGTLLEVSLAECAEAGQELAVELVFELQLGEDVDERVGTSSTEDVAWFATAFPLLAWERGSGWNRGPAVPVTGEMAVSEDFELRALEVVAPSAYEVLGTGTEAGTSDGPDAGTTVHRFVAPAVRDVAVSVGDLDVEHREIGGVRVHLAADDGVAAAEPSRWLDQIARSTERLVELLGPFPYPDLWVTVLSAQTSGVEFPGAIQFGDVDPEKESALVTHELAHMWFYGRVGNDQAQDPWLDEAFATYAQLVTEGGRSSAPDDGPERLRDQVGRPISYFTRYRRPSSAYVRAVYVAGGAALTEARRRAGEEEFDAALRTYLSDNAYSVATPEDVAAAFADLPEVLAALRESGALP